MLRSHWKNWPCGIFRRVFKLRANVGKHWIIWFDLKIIVLTFFEWSSQFLSNLNFRKDENIKLVSLFFLLFLRIEQPLADVLQNRCSQKFRNIHRKTPVLKFLLNKVAGMRACNCIIKETPTLVFSCEHWKRGWLLWLLLWIWLCR